RADAGNDGIDALERLSPDDDLRLVGRDVDPTAQVIDHLRLVPGRPCRLHHATGGIGIDVLGENYDVHRFGALELWHVRRGATREARVRRARNLQSRDPRCKRRVPSMTTGWRTAPMITPPWRATTVSTAPPQTSTTRATVCPAVTRVATSGMPTTNPDARVRSQREVRSEEHTSELQS